MEQTLADPDLDVYLTWDVRRLPALRGPRGRGRARRRGRSHPALPRTASGPCSSATARGPRPRGLADLPRWGLHWLRWLPGAAALARRADRRARRPRAAPGAGAAHPAGHLQPARAARRADARRARRTCSSPAASSTRAARCTAWPPRRPARAARCSPPCERLGEAAARPAHRRARDAPASTRRRRAAADAYSQALMDAARLPGAAGHVARDLPRASRGCAAAASWSPARCPATGSTAAPRWCGSTAGATCRRRSPVLDDPAELERRHAASLAWWQRALLGGGGRPLPGRAPQRRPRRDR